MQVASSFHSENYLLLKMNRDLIQNLVEIFDNMSLLGSAKTLSHTWNSIFGIAFKKDDENDRRKSKLIAL